MADPADGSSEDTPVFDDPNPTDIATVTVVANPTDWNTILWWAVAIWVGYSLLKEGKLT